MDVQLANKVALHVRQQEQALEKITPRVKKLPRQTGLAYQRLKFQKMEKRWGSCTETNNIILNNEAAKPPPPLH